MTASVQSKIAFRNNVIICVQSTIEKGYSNDAQVVRGWHQYYLLLGALQTWEGYIEQLQEQFPR